MLQYLSSPVTKYDAFKGGQAGIGSSESGGPAGFHVRLPSKLVVHHPAEPGNSINAESSVMLTRTARIMSAIEGQLSPAGSASYLPHQRMHPVFGPGRVSQKNSPVRERDLAHGRRMCLRVTDRAHAMLHEGGSIFDEMREQLAERVGEGRLAEVEKALRLLVGGNAVRFDIPGFIARDLDW